MPAKTKLDEPIDPAVELATAGDAAPVNAAADPSGEIFGPLLEAAPLRPCLGAIVRFRHDGLGRDVPAIVNYAHVADNPHSPVALLLLCEKQEFLNYVEYGVTPNTWGWYFAE